MMSEKTWNVVFSKAARKALRKLETSVHARVLNQLQQLAELENPLRHRDVRGLEGKYQDYYRLRVGEYRLIFEIDSVDNEIRVYAIVPRGKAY